MKKILLFHVATIQYGIELTLVKDIKSAKTVVAERTEDGIFITGESNGTKVRLYDLVSIFGKKAAAREGKNEKLILAELNGNPMEMIVSSVNQIVSVHRDRLKPLSPIFEGPSLSCFPKVLQYAGSLILLLRPDGIEEAAKHTAYVQHRTDMTNRVSELTGIAGFTESSSFESTSFPANFLRKGSEISPRTEQEGI